METSLSLGRSGSREAGLISRPSLGTYIHQLCHLDTVSQRICKLLQHCSHMKTKCPKHISMGDSSHWFKQTITEINVKESCSGWECISLVDLLSTVVYPQFNSHHWEKNSHSNVPLCSKVLFRIFPPLPYESAFTYLGVINVRKKH